MERRDVRVMNDLFLFYLLGVGSFGEDPHMKSPYNLIYTIGSSDVVRGSPEDGTRLVTVRVSVEVLYANIRLRLIHFLQQYGRTERVLWQHTWATRTGKGRST